MTDHVLVQTYSSGQPAQKAGNEAKRSGFPAVNFVLRWIVVLICLSGLGWGVALEMRTSYLQSLVFSRLTHDMAFRAGPGPSPNIRFPVAGPYDERLGYTKLSSFIRTLAGRHFTLERQARLSPSLEQFIADGGYAIYHEKTRAGLTLLDHAGLPFFAENYPKLVYGDIGAVPPLVIRTLLFIEDRELLDPRYPTRNPAVEWERFALAATGRIAGWIDPSLRQGGASTLATQIEKYRHSPDGRTRDIQEKLRQMVTAIARTYLDGPDTTKTRQHILLTYLNSTPLGSRPGYGEIIGLGDGLWVWYGTDFAEANRILSEPAHGGAGLYRKARAYKQALSLLLAQRRPSYYLMADPAALSALTDRYLRLLGAAGVIDPALQDSALQAELRFRDQPPSPAAVPFVERKAADAIRTALLSLLHIPSLYSLDRLDLTAQTTLDTAAQKRITDVLSRLGDPEYVKSLGLVGFHLLGREDPSRVNYSVVLYERDVDRNSMRVHADSLAEPFDINSGAKLILGSTAKLRTLVTYLDIMAELHRRYASLSPRELQSASARARDPLSRWALAYLAESRDRSLRKLLDAAMERRYSANPNEVFFTGGGLHVFQNFERSDNAKVPTVAEAFSHSINLAFIRIMRDIVRYYRAEKEEQEKDLLLDVHNPARQTYLQRFADQEGREFLNRFYDDYHDLRADEALTLLASRTRPVPRRLAVVFRSVLPQADRARFRDFLHARLPWFSFDEPTIDSLYTKYSIDRYSLADRGYLAGVHPLELWLVGYLQSHSHASRAEVIKASVAERQAVYAWLFKSHSAHKQNVRIRILLEEDAFNRILRDWRRLGYPFEQLTPSFATAIGSSGDRPDALAELMGIILNGGVKLPAVRIDRLRFAEDTPYETEFAVKPEPPNRVMAPEVADTVRSALMAVVAQGTGERVRSAFASPDGSPLPIGGKTGTGDNRSEHFGPGMKLIDSRVVDRTATFVFFIGDRFFGTVTAYVPGPEAAQYHFTSALTVQLLKALAPALKPLLDSPIPETQAAVKKLSSIH